MAKTKSYRSDEIEPTNYKRGGQVPKKASPSGGKKTDDVKADLSAGEYVIPKKAAQNIGPGNLAREVSAAGGPTPRSITDTLYGGRQHLDEGGFVGPATSPAPAGTSTQGGFSNGGVGSFGPSFGSQGWGGGQSGVAVGAPGTVGGTSTNTSNNSAGDYGPGSTGGESASTAGPASRGGGYSAPSGGYGYGGGSTGYSASAGGSGGTTGGSTAGGYGFSGYGGAGGNAGGGWGYVSPMQGSSYVAPAATTTLTWTPANVQGAAAYFGVNPADLTLPQLTQYLQSKNSGGSTTTPVTTTTPAATPAWGTPGSTIGATARAAMPSVASVLSSLTPSNFATGTSSQLRPVPTAAGVSPAGSVVGNVGGTYGVISPTPGAMAGWRGGGY